MQSLLDLGVKYIVGPFDIANARRHGKKIIASFLPPMELIFATKNSLPIFLPRLTEFPFSRFIGLANIINHFHLFKRIVRYYINNREKFSGGNVGGSFNSINQEEISKIFTNLIQVAEKSDFYMDTCVQTRISYGAFIRNLHLVDLIVGGFEGNYCTHFAKFYERISKYKPVFYFEKPYGDYSNSHVVDLVTSELRRFIDELEKLTGSNITNARLRKIALLKNEIRGYIGELYQYYIKGFVPVHTTGLILISGAYIDYLGDMTFYRNSIKKLLNEIRRKRDLPNYRKEKIFRVVMAGSPGCDPSLPAIFENNGAVLLYLDLFESAFRGTPIKTTGDMIENYVNHLLDLNIKEGIQDVINIWIGEAKRIQADAILFSHVWGCRFTTPAYRKMKDRVIEELGIPIFPLDFYSPGENVGQIKTRIGAFMEMLK